LFSRRRGVGKWKGRSAFQAAGVFSTPALCGSQVWERSIFVAGRQHSPGDSCQFVGCSGHHHVERRPSLQRIEPRSERGSFAFHAYHRRTRSMNQDLTQVAVSSLADTQEPGLAASGMLSGHESEPRMRTPGPCGKRCRCRSLPRWPSRSTDGCRESAAAANRRRRRVGPVSPLLDRGNCRTGELVDG
jgi:hypothetical protein